MTYLDNICSFGHNSAPITWRLFFYSGKNWYLKNVICNCEIFFHICHRRNLLALTNGVQIFCLSQLQFENTCSIQNKTHISPASNFGFYLDFYDALATNTTKGYFFYNGRTSNGKKISCRKWDFVFANWNGFLFCFTMWTPSSNVCSFSLTKVINITDEAQVTKKIPF